MTRFFFHLRTDHRHPDPDGIELTDLQAARLKALELLGKQVTESPTWNHREWNVEIADDHGLLFNVYSDTAAVGREF